ncbi:MAG: ABC transporter permease [Oscillospiraceae bacterium]|nr:ABC transporter permease [Oscillospiraceae bacterium]
MKAIKDFLTVFIKSHKFCWSDRFSVAVFVIFPIVIIFVLSQALGGAFEGNMDFGEDFTIPITVVCEAGEGETSTLGEFLLGDGLTDFFSTTFVDNIEEAEELMKSEESNLIVTIENENELSLFVPEYSWSNTRLALSVVEQFNQTNQAIQITMGNSDDLLSDLASIEQIMASELTIREYDRGEDAVSALNFFAVTMIIMFMLFSGEYGLQLFKQSLFNETGSRMLTTPVSKTGLIGGLLLGATIASFLQGMVVFLFTKFVYGIDWGNEIWLVVLTLFGIVMFAQAFAIFIFVIVKKANAANVVLQGCLFVMTFVSGGFNGQAFDFAFVRYVPNSLASTVMFGTMFNDEITNRMFSDLGLLFAYSFVLFIIAAVLGRRKLYAGS